jgi:hypothetical protein
VCNGCAISSCRAAFLCLERGTKKERRKRKGRRGSRTDQFTHQHLARTDAGTVLTQGTRRAGRESADKSQPRNGNFGRRIRNSAHFGEAALAYILSALCGMTPSHPATRTSNRLEIALGRSLAACLHPMAAWRVFPGPRRYLIAGAYGVAAYGAVLAALLLLS